MEKIYDTLTSDVRAQIDSVTRKVLDTFTSEDGKVDLVLLMATLEQLNGAKKEIKETAAKIAKDKAEEIRKQAELAGKRYIETLQVGDMFTFRYGTGGKQTATLPIDKVGDKTVQVTYPKDMLPEGSKTAKRNIRFDKVVVPEEFAAQLVA